jgi:hypothetical protein
MMLRRSQQLKNFSMDTILKFGKARDGCAILIPRTDEAASVGGLFHFNQVRNVRFWHLADIRGIATFCTLLE